MAPSYDRQTLASKLPRFLARLAWAGGLTMALHAQAGLSLEQALARHRGLSDIDAGHSDGFIQLAAPTDGLSPVLGGPDDRTPLLLDPTLRGRGGARLVATPLNQRDGRGASLRLGLNWHEGATAADSLEGSALSLPALGGRLYASVEPRHWGPGWVGSLILDAAAPPVPAVGWRKTGGTTFHDPWLSWLGPWNADVFMGQLRGHDDPARPQFVGMRLQIRPLPSLELGASRTLQWGGKGLDNSAGALANALVGRDNGQSANADPGNQLAGFDARYGIPVGGGHAAVYGQMVGEDEAGKMPSQWIAQLGLEWAPPRRGMHTWRLFAEASDLVAGEVTGDAHYGSTYRHHLYHQGYTNDGLPLGHAAGGDVRLLSAGALYDGGRVGGVLAAHGGKAAKTSQRFQPDASLAGLNAAAFVEFGRGSRIGLAAWWWRAGTERSSALQAWWHTAWR
jgi:hypothetical protein